MAARATATAATGTGVTCTAALPATPSMVAVMTAEPGATARMRPLLATTATAGLLDDQSTTRPSIDALSAPRATTVRSRLSPTKSAFVAGVTVTVVTAAPRTTTAAVPSRPSALAKSNPAPGLMPRTVPSTATEKNEGAPLIHVMGRCASTAPAASSACALATTLLPASRSIDTGATRTETTGDGNTTTVADPVRPSLVTVIVADPGAAAVTVPSPPTRATVSLLLAKVSGRPLSRVPLASVICTVSRTVCPTAIDDCDGDTITALTGRGRTTTSLAPLLPPFDAVIVTMPGATPNTRPLDETVATAPDVELHAMVRSGSTLPALSRATAVSCVDCPTITLSRAGETDTDAVGTGNTVTPTDAVRLSLVAEMVATPGVSPLTTPPTLTTATR